TLDDHIATLRTLTKDNPSQQLRMKEIESTILTRLAQLDRSIKERSLNGFESARDHMMTDVGKQTMDALRQQVGLAVGTEERLLTERTEAERRYFSRNFYLLLLGNALGVIILLTLYLFLWRELNRRIKSESALTASHDLLARHNEELRRARDERQRMEELLGKYSDLYDFAPVGYFNLDQDGAIRSVNQTGATFLGQEPSALVGSNLDRFLSDETRPVFHDFLDQ